VNDGFLLDSGLRLAPTRAADAPFDDNGLLQAWELLKQMDLTANLVTLSTCDSARGRSLPGEGAMSLARAFHGAGARSVISALWAIDDRATAALMTALYEGLRAGLPKDEALRQAQLRLLRGEQGRAKWAKPVFWAAFQLSGDWQ
jgi:CHAT domain-containing protein